MRGTTSLPFVRHEDVESDLLANGGQVVRFTAGAALNVGDAVYISTTNTVNKSNTAANMQKFAGVVVGGKSTYFQACSKSADVGVAACGSGEDVLVQINGRAWVVADAAITVATLLTQGATTAGRVDDAAGATQGQIIGIALQAASNAADKLLMLINHM